VLTQKVGNATTRFAYNTLGQLIQETDALGQIETSAYDANGLVTTKTDRNGTTFSYTYDHMGRVARQNAIQHGAVTGFRAYTYTTTGALLRDDSESYATWNHYDAQGRLHAQVENGGFVRWYYYNEANNLTQSLVYTDWWGSQAKHMDTTYSYHNNQRLNGVWENGVYQASHEYDANGRRTTRHLGNGTSAAYTYNPAGLVTHLRNYNRNTGAGLSSFNYSYHLDGNTQNVVESISGITRTVTYAYDLARRLISEHDTGAGAGTVSRNYAFDNRGNRTQISVTGAETYNTAYTYDLNHDLHL
jgi:YD repeat-containing protein